MSHCINTSHPEYKSLLEQSNQSAASLKADISIWQEENELDKFPSLEDFSFIGIIDQTTKDFIKPNKIVEINSLTADLIESLKLRKKNPIINIVNIEKFGFDKGIQLVKKEGKNELKNGFYKGFVEANSDAFYKYYNLLDFKNPIKIGNSKKLSFLLSNKIRIETIEEKNTRLELEKKQKEAIKNKNFFIKPAITSKSNDITIAKETKRLLELNEFFKKQDDLLARMKANTTELIEDRNNKLKTLDSKIEEKLNELENKESKQFLIDKIKESLIELKGLSTNLDNLLDRLPVSVLTRLVFNLEKYDNNSYEGSYILTEDKEILLPNLNYYEDDVIKYFNNTLKPSTNQVLGQVVEELKTNIQYNIKNNIKNNAFSNTLKILDQAIESVNKKILNNELKGTLNKKELILLNDFVQELSNNHRSKNLIKYIERLNGKKTKFISIILEGLETTKPNKWYLLTNIGLNYLNSYKSTVQNINYQVLKKNKEELKELYEYADTVEEFNRLVKQIKGENLSIVIKKAFIDLNKDTADHDTAIHEIGHFIYDLGKDLKSYKEIDNLIKKLSEKSESFRDYIKNLKNTYKKKLTIEEFESYNFDAELFAKIYQAVLTKEGELYNILEKEKINDTGFIRYLTQKVIDFLKDIINFNSYADEFKRAIDNIHEELENYKQAEVEINNNKFEYKLFNEEYADIEKEIEDIKQDFIAKGIIIEDSKKDPDFLMDSFNKGRIVYSDETKKHESMLYHRLTEHFNEEQALHIFLLTHTKNFKTWFHGTSKVFRNDLGEPELYFHGSGSVYYEVNRNKMKSGEGAMAYGAGLYLTDEFNTSSSYAQGASSRSKNIKYKDLYKKLFNKKVINKENNPFIHELFINAKNPLNLDGSISERISKIIADKVDFIKYDNSLNTKDSIKKGGLYYVNSRVNGTTLYETIQDYLYDKEAGIRIENKSYIRKSIGDTTISPQASVFLANIGIEANYRFAGGARNAFGGQHKRGEMHVIVFESNNLKSVNNIGTFNPNNPNKYYSLKDDNKASIEEKFKKYIKLPKLGKQVSSLNRTLIQERIESFNKENNTSFYVNFEQVGEVANDNFKIISIVNKAKSSEPTLFDEQDEEYLPENQNTESQEVNEPISSADLTEQQQTVHKNSQLNQYFGNKKVKKASELLPLLYGRTKEGFFYNLIQQVLKVFHNDVNVKVLTEEEFIKYKEENKLKFNESTDGLRINGGYVSKLNEIFVVDYADSNMDTIILHEVLHSLSYHYLRENTSLNEEFQDLYNKAKSLLSKEEKAKYAISDIDEFFAHLSDPNFIKLLASKKSVNTEGLTIWAKLKQILTEVLKSLGIEVNGTFLEDYFNLATRILQEAKNTDDFYKRYDEEYGDNPVNANATSLDKEINVQDSNFKALEKNNKTVSIREVGKHDYKRGDILTVKVNNKATDTKVRVTSVTTIQDFTKLSKQEKDEFAKSIGNYIDFEDFQNSNDYANATSPQSLKYPHVYKFITGKEPADIVRYTLVEKSIVDQESPYKKQQIFLSRKIKRLEQELKQINPASYSYEAKSNEIKALKEKLAKAIGSKNDHSIYLELGEELFKEIDELLTKFETSEPTTDKLTYVGQVLEAWKDFEDLEGKAKKLYRRYRLLVAEHTLKTANEHNTGGKKITREDLDKDTKDIRTFTMGTGALSDSVNIIARTIGSIIKAAQNFVATKNKLLAKEIQTEIDLLDQYAKKNGVTLDELYKEVFIQEHKNSTILTKPYFEDGTPNPNYDKIQDTPELKKFYEFYQKKIEEFEKGLPQSFGKYFIPNIAKTGIKDDIKNLNPFQKRKVGFSFNTENMADIIETKYEAFIPASRKESNLGEVLLKFGMYANNYEKMSSVLPEVRLLQEQLEYKINSKGEPIEREFINPSDPSKSVTGKKSKIWKQVDGVINMQVKGNMKDEGQGKYRVKTTKYDKEGNPKEEIYFNLTGLLDNLLKYNSLLRIGLSPITAISNVIFGDASNLIEAIGGQFFGVKDLTTASNIFIRQNLNKDSNLNKLLVELNPLQELDDYEYQEQIRLTGKTVKMSKEKAQEYIYGMQKSGEKWLQSRTMLAVLIHDGYMNTNGDLLQKYEDLTEEQKTQLTDKIQRLNQQIHGRYTQKEAAVWQQSVVYRMISQFRKWIPAAIESRIGSKRYDSRLQTEVEGRYITIKNLVVNLQDTLERLKKGELTETETYNMRKSLAEIIMLLATVFLYAGLKGDDDDKKRRKNPYVKLALTLLNRTAGDLGYFYDPTQVATIGNKAIPLSKTVEDLIKVVEYLPYAVYPGDFKIMGKKFSDTHKSGSIKGYNKFYNQLGKQIPGIKPIKDLTRIASDFELEELR